MSLLAMIKLINPTSFDNMMFVVSDTEFKISHMFKLDNGQMIDLYGQLLGYDLGSRQDDELIELDICGSTYEFSKELALIMYSAVEQWFGDAVSDNPNYEYPAPNAEMDEEASRLLDERIARYVDKYPEMNAEDE